jgi:predicted HTH domain antitoxin
MKKTKVVPLRIPESLDKLAAVKAEIDHMDKATALRQWLHEGAEDYVLSLLGEARISIGRAVELLGITYYDIYPLIEARGIQLGPTDDQLAQSSKNVEKVVAALKSEQSESQRAAG